MTEPQEQAPGAEAPLANTAPEQQEVPDAFQSGWSDVFDALPGDYKKLVEAPLREHDKKYQELQTNWNSVKDIPEEYRKDPERITQAMKVLERINNDPYGTMELMAQQLGVEITQKQVEQAVKEAEKQQVTPDGPVFTEDDDPRLQKMWDIIQQQNQRWEAAVGNLTQVEQERYQKEIQAQEDRKVDEQVTALINSGQIPNDPNDPNVQKYYVSDLMMRARIALDAGAKDPIAEGLKQQQQFLQFHGSRQQAAEPKNYPLFMPTNGAAPANAPKPPDTTTEAGRLAIMQQIARQAAG